MLVILVNLFRFAFARTGLFHCKSKTRFFRPPYIYNKTSKFRKYITFFQIFLNFFNLFRCGYKNI